MATEIEFIDDDPVDGVPYPPDPRVATRAGFYRIAGTLTVEGDPARYRVRVCERRSGHILAAGISAEDGSYEFTHLPSGEYIVYAIDHTRTYNAAVADAVVAVPME